MEAKSRGYSLDCACNWLVLTAIPTLKPGSDAALTGFFLMLDLANDDPVTGDFNDPHLATTFNV